MSMNWNITNSTTPRDRAQLREILLANLNLKNKTDFFSPTHPLEISLTAVDLDKAQLQAAVKRILVAQKKQQKIVIWADYDADGVCSSAILWQALYDLGCKVTPFFPHRDKHGYGLSDKALDDFLAKEKPSLIITVDNGIVAHQPAQRVINEGIDLIITDHHQPEDKLPPALAVVHSTKLCGATVAWMLAREVMLAVGEKIDSAWQLDLAAVATIADQVPLQGANRSFAKHGLEALRKSERLGIKALLAQAKQDQKAITSQTVGFGIAPRINAMGRLGHSLDALRLLLTKNKARAKQLAKVLGETNAKRQEMTYEMYGQALAQVKEWQDESIIIVYSSDFHEGVVGLIAGRLMEKFHKPAIAISVGGGIGKASARSVAGVNIVELIREARDDLLEVGGHPMAAGFGVDEKKLDKVIERLKKLAKEKIDKKLLQPSVEVAALIPFKLVHEKTIDVIEEFAPFGQGNREPILGIKEVRVLQVLTMGADNQHLKVVGQVDEEMTPVNFLWWRHGAMADKINEGDKIDVAGVLEINEWRGRKSVQMRVKDIA